jgi:hypothetical protein
MNGRLAADRGDRGARLEHRLGVGVEVEVALFGVGIAPGDHEHLLALSHEPFDHAAARREVEHVVLVDRRRREQQRDLPDLLGLRRVLDELEHLAAEHDRARRERQVLSHRELGGVDRGRQARKVAHEAPCPPDQVEASLVQALFDDARVRPREVARRERIDHVARGETGLALVAPLQIGVGDQAVHGLAHRQVGLQHSPEQPAGLPRRVGEASIALGWAGLGAPARDTDELRAQAPRAARRPIGPARDADGDADGRSRTQEARSLSDRRVGEYHVQRGACRLGGGAWTALARRLRHPIITCSLTRSQFTVCQPLGRSHRASVVNPPRFGCEPITGAAGARAGQSSSRKALIGPTTFCGSSRRKRCPPPATTCTRALGRRAASRRALRSGTLGSCSPATISVGCATR